MTETRRTSLEEARRVGDAIGVDWNRFDLEQFRMGMDVEFEHGATTPRPTSPTTTRSSPARSRWPT